MLPKERQKIAMREWRRKYPGYMAERSKKWRKENKDRVKDYLQKNKDRRRLRFKQWELERRLTLLDHYSNGEFKCTCCGEMNMEFLCLSFIDGGGNAYKREHGAGGAFYSHLIRMGFPEGIHVLCASCNMAFTMYGHCPHQREKEKSDGDR